MKIYLLIGSGQHTASEIPHCSSAMTRDEPAERKEEILVSLPFACACYPFFRF